MSPIELSWTAKKSGFNFQNNIYIWFPEHRSSEVRLSPKSASTESGPLELNRMLCNKLQTDKCWKES